MMVGGQATFGQFGLLLALGSVLVFVQPISGIQNCIESRPDKAIAHCEKGCKFGFFGPYCNESCPDSCDAACSQATGNCLTGCDPTWFKSNCSRNCIGQCKYDICDIRSSDCIHGCVDGYYGTACDKRCSENCTGGVCDEFGGCSCKKGVNDTACYVDCTDNCIDGQCAPDSSGQPTCSIGCQAGRTGNFCQEWCKGDCHDKIAHSRQTKRDLQNTCCNDGWTGDNCSIKCPNCIYSTECIPFCEGGYFGDECHLNCSNTCSKETNGRPGCKKDSGKCHSGCLQGYYGFTCTKQCGFNCHGRRCFQDNGNCIKCVPSKYGPKCEDDCGHCNDEQCGRNGTCRDCEQGWYGLRCQYKCTDKCESNNCRVDVRGNHVCVGDCLDGYTGDGCSEKCPSGCPEGCFRKNGTCPDMHDSNGAVKTSTQETKCSEDLNIGAVVGGVVAGLAVVGVVVLILWWKGKIRCPCSQQARTPEEPFVYRMGEIAQNTEEHDERPNIAIKPGEDHEDGQKDSEAEAFVKVDDPYTHRAKIYSLHEDDKKGGGTIAETEANV